MPIFSSMMSSNSSLIFSIVLSNFWIAVLDMHACRYPIAKCHGDPEPRALPKCWGRKGAAGALAAGKDEVCCESRCHISNLLANLQPKNGQKTIKTIIQILARKVWKNECAFTPSSTGFRSETTGYSMLTLF